MSYTYSFPLINFTGLLNVYNLAAETYPLDVVGSATGAYSVRKLSVSYAGYALRIRRSSDSATLDVGFLGYKLNTPAILSFVGGGNGFVATWYDQSGNGRDLTQATAGSQPQMVSSGVFTNLLAGFPSLDFTGSMSLDASVASSNFITTTAGTVLGVWSADTVSGASVDLGRKLWGPNGNNALYVAYNGPNAASVIFDSAYKGATVAISTGVAYVGAWRRNGTQLFNHINSSTPGATTAVGTGAALSANMRVGNNTSGPGWDGRISELIFWNTELTTGNLDSVGPAVASPYGITWS